MKKQIGYAFWKFVEFVLLTFLKIGLYVPLTRKRVLAAIDFWAYADLSKSLRMELCYLMQDSVSRLTGRKICTYCKYSINPNLPHEYCDRELSKTTCPVCGYDQVYPADGCVICQEKKLWEDHNAETPKSWNIRTIE
ncbi:MAG: hypothetical protein NT141_02300 [candidate division WWE3 bacterium]|nr:hypothetical protein [candidate division WWE3 bacterium]